MSYAHAVGGHANTLQKGLTAATVIKPCLPVEKQFYSQLGPSLGGPDFIGVVTPAYYGLLTAQADQPVPDEEKQMIVLESLTWRFLRPNVLDIKLGTQLHDEDAGEEKKQRMIETAKATTSYETGVRLTGMQTWDPKTGLYVTVDKSYGKTIKADRLPEGIKRFFAPDHSPLPLDYKIVLLKLVLRRIDDIYMLVKSIEWRSRGSSLLIVYEGDADAFEDSCSPDRGGIDGSDDEEEDIDGDCRPAHRIPFDVRLIDFAHTRAAPGEGPDEGYLLGLRTTKKLISSLLDELSQQRSS